MERRWLTAEGSKDRLSELEFVVGIEMRDHASHLAWHCRRRDHVLQFGRLLAARDGSEPGLDTLRMS